MDSRLRGNDKFLRMGLFSKQETSVLGVDLGASSVKMVELKQEKRQMHLVTYGFSSGDLKLPEDDLEQRNLQAALIKKVAEGSKVKTKQAVASVPLSDVFSATVRIPNVAKKEQTALIEREAQKFLPFPVAEAVVDWKVIEPKKKKEQKDSKSFGIDKKEIASDIQVLITAAPRATVTRIADVFKRAGFTLKGLETEAFALVRSLIGNDPTSVLLVDVGAVRSNFFVVENTLPVMHRSMALGGVNFTQALDNVLKVGLEKAELMKSDIMSTGAIEADESGFPKIFQQTIQPLINEIRYTMNLYTTQQGGTHPERIVLTGGSSLLPNLDAFLSHTFNMKVYVGDPWARTWYPENLRPALYEIGTRFAVSVGLALRDSK